MMIDEKKLKKDLDRYGRPHFLSVHDENLFKVVLDIIENQPKVGEWIPVSCETPTPFGAVLVYRKDKIITRGFYINFEDEVAFWLTDSDEDYGKSEVIAWMPLPEPYKGGEDDE